MPSPWSSSELHPQCMLALWILHVGAQYVPNRVMSQARCFVADRSTYCPKYFPFRYDSNRPPCSSLKARDHSLQTMRYKWELLFIRARCTASYGVLSSGVPGYDVMSIGGYLGGSGGIPDDPVIPERGNRLLRNIGYYSAIGTVPCLKRQQPSTFIITVCVCALEPV